MGMASVLNISRINKEEFVKKTKEKPTTYQDWTN